MKKTKPDGVQYAFVTDFFRIWEIKTNIFKSIRFDPIMVYIGTSDVK
jgi:hypothetical protein